MQLETALRASSDQAAKIPCADRAHRSPRAGGGHQRNVSADARRLDQLGEVVRANEWGILSSRAPHPLLEKLLTA
jgi:hypothetical protein